MIRGTHGGFPSKIVSLESRQLFFFIKQISYFVLVHNFEKVTTCNM